MNRGEIVFGLGIALVGASYLGVGFPVDPKSFFGFLPYMDADSVFQNSVVLAGYVFGFSMIYVGGKEVHEREPIVSEEDFVVILTTVTSFIERVKAKFRSIRTA